MSIIPSVPTVKTSPIMPSTDHSFGTNNPFRRRTTSNPSSGPDNTDSTVPSSKFDGIFEAPPSTIRPPFTTFKNAGNEDEGRDDEPIQPRPKKIVKKVRVLSPPPSSPEDVVPVNSFPPDDDDESSSSISTNSDSGQIENHEHPFDTEDKQLESPLPRPPPNPFSRTLQDLEQNTQDQHPNFSAAGGGKGSLDVDSFKRLLLTGYANTPAPSGGSGGPSSGPVHDGASNTDASSISRQSVLDAMQETPRTSHEVSELDESEERRRIMPSSPLSGFQTASGRKAPPPPSSRHGKLIKMELGANAPGRTKRSPSAMKIDTNASNTLNSPQTQSPPSSSDVNKPLPLPPSHGAAEEEIDSPFDREAAGKIPETFAAVLAEPRPPTPTAGSQSRSESRSSTLTASSVRKPAAPPPRRHGRTDSKAGSMTTDTAEEDPPRSSLESSRSRADSLRANSFNSNANAAVRVPPPRRPTHVRQGSSFTSHSAASFTSISSLGGSDEARSPAGAGYNSTDRQNLNTMAIATTNKDGFPKISPPPPPPARNSSTRRPPSISSLETGSGNVAASRKASREKEGGIAPPPPPPRARGSSRGSSTNLGVPRSPNGEVSRVDEEPVVDKGVAGGTELLKGLEDLEALKKEVEAAMKVGSG